MSIKRKVLLGVTIGIIAGCYLWAFYAIKSKWDSLEESRVEERRESLRLRNREKQTETYLLNESMQSHWVSFDDDEYSISYPTSWEIDKAGQIWEGIRVISPFTSSDDMFRDYVDLLIYDFRGINLPSDRLVEVFRESRKSWGWRVIQSGWQSANGRDFYRTIATEQRMHYELIYIIHIWFENGKAYVLTFSCEPMEFAMHKETAERIMNSFRLK